MTTTPPAAPVPAGWYPDGVNGQRYWDGTAWTEHRAPAAAAKAKMPGGTVAAFVLAIVGFVLLPIPLGIGLFLGGIPDVIAIVLGIIALVGQNKTGRGFALAAIIIAGVSLLSILLGAGTIW